MQYTPDVSGNFSEIMDCCCSNENRNDTNTGKEYCRQQKPVAERFRTAARFFSYTDVFLTAGCGRGIGLSDFGGMVLRPRGLFGDLAADIFSGAAGSQDSLSSMFSSDSLSSAAASVVTGSCMDA